MTWGTNAPPIRSGVRGERSLEDSDQSHSHPTISPVVKENDISRMSRTPIGDFQPVTVPIGVCVPQGVQHAARGRLERKETCGFNPKVLPPAGGAAAPAQTNKHLPCILTQCLQMNSVTIMIRTVHEFTPEGGGGGGGAAEGSGGLDEVCNLGQPGGGIAVRDCGADAVPRCLASSSRVHEPIRLLHLLLLVCSMGSGNGKAKQ